MKIHTLELERDGAVAVLRISRPPANALNLPLAREATAALTALAADEDLRALILTGTGAYFSAGLDLKEVPSYSPQEQRAMVEEVNRVFACLYAFPLPTIAAINGHTIGGGLIAALSCDYRLSTSAPCKIGLTEVRVGVPYPAVALEVVRAELTPQAARVLALGARYLSPEGALALGILDELTPPDALSSRALSLAHDRAGMPKDAYSHTKRQLRRGTIAALQAIVEKKNDPLLEAWHLPETQDAAQLPLERSH